MLGGPVGAGKGLEVMGVSHGCWGFPGCWSVLWVLGVYPGCWGVPRMLGRVPGWLRGVSWKLGGGGGLWGFWGAPPFGHNIVGC